MNILVIGTEADFNVLENKLGQDHEYVFVEDVSLALNELEDQNLIFDFQLEDSPENLDAYRDLSDTTVFINIPKISLAELKYYHPDMAVRMVGFNGLPGFFENEKWELSTLSESDHSLISEIFGELGQQYYIVKDRVGMVAPRVICMIINEAFYTVQEGTATKEDIDLGMKLGTNYPYGPFEWLQRIGVHHVYELLEAIYDDTKDERYKICPLLKREYLLIENRSTN